MHYIYDKEHYMTPNVIFKAPHEREWHEKYYIHSTPSSQLTAFLPQLKRNQWLIISECYNPMTQYLFPFP